MQTAKKIVIVGGGIGGAATALALYHAGFDVMVYERTPELREVGAGVALWANATHVLKNLGVLQDTLSASQLIARLLLPNVCWHLTQKPLLNSTNHRGLLAPKSLLKSLYKQPNLVNGKILLLWHYGKYS